MPNFKELVSSIKGKFQFTQIKKTPLEIQTPCADTPPVPVQNVFQKTIESASPDNTINETIPLIVFQESPNEYDPDEDDKALNEIIKQLSDDSFSGLRLYFRDILSTVEGLI